MSVFENVIERRETRSIKWDRMEEFMASKTHPIFYQCGLLIWILLLRKLLSMRCKNVLDHGVFGYSYICE